MESEEVRADVDELDLLILEALVRSPESSFKVVAKELNVDQRTVAKRIRNMSKEGVLRQTYEIEWAKLGLKAEAVVGSTTARGIDYARKLGTLVESDPRIVEAYETLGTYHYFMKIIETDTSRMRDSVLRDLDVLAAELTTTLLTRRIKQDYPGLIRYLRETRYPRSRGRVSP